MYEKKNLFSIIVEKSVKQQTSKHTPENKNKFAAMMANLAIYSRNFRTN